jgi:hypothetical protein
MMSSRVLSAVFVALFLWVSPGLANPILVLNPSFEDPSCGTVAPVTCFPANWTVTVGVGGAFLPASTAWNSIPDGIQVGWSNSGTLTQNLAVNITPDTIYTLSVWVSQRWTAGSFFPQIQLFGGSTALLTMNNSNPGGAAPTQNLDGTYSWVDWSMSWKSPSSGPIIGQNLSISLGSDAIQTDFDSVSLTASPEPGMFALFAGGLIGLIARGRLVK